jgi:hypothetical protein
MTASSRRFEDLFSNPRSTAGASTRKTSEHQTLRRALSPVPCGGRDSPVGRAGTLTGVPGGARCYTPARSLDVGAIESLQERYLRLVPLP